MKKIALILLFLFLSSQNVFCQEVGKIVSAQGRVDIFKEGSQSAIPAVGDDSISVGDSIRTKSGSRAQVIFRDKSVLKLAQSSKVLIKDYQLDNKERRTSATIELSRGKARAIIAKTPSGTPFVIKTPNAEGTVKGSDVTAFYQAGNSGMFVAEGKLSVINIAHPKNIITVPKGNACVIPMDELPKGPRPYLDAEKKLNDEDTYVPVSISKTSKVSVIKGAVAKLSGSVKIIPKGASEARNASLHDILGEGDRIETGENGYIEIRLDNNNAINLKPNTKLTIVRLVINPETGEFDNIFEVTLGNVKARIENLKGSSKFEVKTPQAICGARGTIMYVGVSNGSTTSFFEGGKGYLTNTFTGNTQDLPPGTSSTADQAGNVSAPTNVSDTDRQSYGEGWDAGSGVEGYSSPDGNSGVDPSNTGTSGGINDFGDGTGNDAAGQNGEGALGAGVPFTESHTVTLMTPPSGISYAFSGYATHESGVHSAVFAGMESLWTGAPDIAFIGTYGEDRPSAGLWKFHSVGTTSDGASIYGMAGGTNLNDGLKGILYAIYVRPDPDHPGQYITGYLKSTDLSGKVYSNIYSDLSLFEADGNLDVIEMGRTAVSPDELLSYMYNDELNNHDSPIYRNAFIGSVGGDITGTFDGESIGISSDSPTDQMWSISRVEARGVYQAPLQGNWHAVYGNHETESGDTGYSIGHVNGLSWYGNEFSGSLTGRGIWYSPVSFETSTLASTTGETIGTYANGVWSATTFGLNEELPLSFGGILDGNGDDTTGNFAYYDAEIGGAAWDEDSHITGLLGGTDSLWNNDPSPQVTIIGEFANPTNRKLWGVDIKGDTKDGGAFSGATGGTWVNNILKGISYAFYVRPDGSGGYRCGYLKSTDIIGDSYAGINMFETTTGTFSFNLDLPTLINPGELNLKIEEGGRVIGSISGANFNGKIDASSDNIYNEDWSLWKASLGGTYASKPSTAWTANMGGWSIYGTSGEIDSYWLGTLDGDDAWQENGEFSGTVSVKSLSDENIQNNSGNALGAYNTDDGTWEALALGVSTSTTQGSLTSGGRFVAQGWDLGEGATFDFAGLIGLTGTIWADESQPKFISMGEFTPPDILNPNKQFAWYVQKEWYSGDTLKEDGFVSRYRDDSVYRYTTHDDLSDEGSGVGSFYGLSAGVGGDSKLKGKIYSLYISPTGDAGVLYGDIDGDYYADIKMYEMYNIEGMGLTKKFYNSVGILPANLRDNISWDTLSGLEDGGGFFDGGDINASGGSGNMLNIAGQEWGVWNLVTGGTYSGTTYDLWNIYDLTGMTMPGATSADTNYACGSWLGGFDGTKWSGGEIEGNVNAIWIVLGKDGTLSGRKLSGPLTGYYAEDETGGSGTWKTGAAGEWARPQDIIEGNQYSNLLAGPGMDSNIIALGGTNVPITVACSSIMNLVEPTCGIQSLTMNTSLYNMAGGGDGIWAAIINGAYSITPTADWTVTVEYGSDNAILSGPAWSSGKWAADVSGTVGGNVITGKAAGTYTEPGEAGGSFTGAGTGTFAQQQTPPPQYE